MLHVLVVVVAISQVEGQEFRVRAVDLKGDPISAIHVQVGGAEIETNSNGMARFQVDGSVNGPGKYQIRVNMESDTERLNPNFIGRVKDVEWDSAATFFGGFVVPLWEWGEVNSLGTAVVTNPNHYAVVVRYDRPEVSSTRVLAKYEGDVQQWIERTVPDLPAVSAPHLARSLYATLDAGRIVPDQFAAEMDYVYRAVETTNRAARICRRFPDRAQPQPAPQLPNFPQRQATQPQLPPFPQVPATQPVQPQVRYRPEQPIAVPLAPRPQFPCCALGRYLAGLLAPRGPQNVYRQDLSRGLSQPYAPAFTSSNSFPTTGAISH